jgi:hypothetical protein
MATLLCYQQQFLSGSHTPPPDYTALAISINEPLVSANIRQYIHSPTNLVNLEHI